MTRSYSRDKLDTLVDFPLTGLDMAPYLLPKVGGRSTVGGCVQLLLPQGGGCTIVVGAWTWGPTSCPGYVGWVAVGWAAEFVSSFAGWAWAPTSCPRWVYKLLKAQHLFAPMHLSC